VQSLRSALEKHPRVGSRLELHNGKTTFHLESGQIDIHLIKVGRDVLSQSPSNWLHVCEKTMPPQKGGYGLDATPLFEASMLVSDDLSAGCVLIVGFQHVLGDAACYSMFLRTWSEMYEANLHAHLGKLPALTFPTVEFQLPMARRQSRALRRFFSFSAEGISSLKSSVPDGCTTNDLLMAQAACAFAPARLAAMGQTAEQAGAARIVIMADRRGRGLAIDIWGNHVVDLSIEISFQLLASGDGAAVARGESASMFVCLPPASWLVCLCIGQCPWLVATHFFAATTTPMTAIRAAVHYELQKLELDVELYNYHKDKDGSRPKLFIWNSWARLGHNLRSATFGGTPEDLLQVEWLNLQNLDVNTSDSIVAISPSNTSGLTIAVANGTPSAQGEMSALGAVWSEAVRAPALV